MNAHVKKFSIWQHLINSGNILIFVKKELYNASDIAHN